MFIRLEITLNICGKQGLTLKKNKKIKNKQMFPKIYLEWEDDEGVKKRFSLFLCQDVIFKCCFYDRICELFML
uniref:Uncharacterized protein n=1 Tax=Anguilla anguilla TaxID=7936 RepID=A0A0E9XBS7_ANGAN